MSDSYLGFILLQPGEVVIHKQPTVPDNFHELDKGASLLDGWSLSARTDGDVRDAMRAGLCFRILFFKFMPLAKRFGFPRFISSSEKMKHGLGLCRSGLKDTSSKRLKSADIWPI